MQALVCERYGSPESLRIRELDDPDPGKLDVVVDVAAAGVNFPDILTIAGKYQVKTKPPFVPGNEAAGVVARVGADVSKFRPGDSVLINSSGGAFASKCMTREDRVSRIPEGLNFEHAAGFGVTYGTSYHALAQGARLQPGETVLVLGAAGGVGSAAVEIAKAMGAHVIAAASSSSKLEFARQAGADELINYAEQPLKESIKELTKGKGVDVVYDPVGGDLADQALRATAWHGRYLVVGFASGEIPALAANLVLLKEASIIGVWWGPWAERNPQLQAQNMAELGDLYTAGKLSPRVTESFAYQDFAKAFATIADRRVLGKVVMRF